MGSHMDVPGICGDEDKKLKAILYYRQQRPVAEVNRNRVLATEMYVVWLISNKTMHCKSWAEKEYWGKTTCTPERSK